jgi:diguanylate cyclase (GGDEF)-like protein
MMRAANGQQRNAGPSHEPGRAEETSISRRMLSRLERAAWRARLRRPVVSAAIVALVWSAGAFGFVWQWEDSLGQAKLTAAARNHLAALQDGLDDYLSKLTSVRALFEASDEVTRREFQTFTRRLLENESAIQNFSWVPRVTRAERAALEAAAIRDGIPGYGIKAVSAEDRIVPSPQRDEYFPIFYSSVAQNTSPVYGIDLGSQPAIRARLERARDHDRLSVVPDFILHSVAGNVRAFLFSLPVYRAGLPHDSVEERRRNLLGFVHGGFFSGLAFEKILSTSTGASGLNLSIFAPDAGPGTAPLHTHTSRLAGEPADAATLAAATRGRHFAGELAAGDEHWTVIATPVPGGPLRIAHDRAWLVLAASLLIGAIALFHIHTSSRQARRLLQANAQITDLAQTDPLTGLMNRGAFADRLGAAFAACRRGAPPFALLYFDLDHFKDVNDTLGHPIGDRLLREVADRVRGAVRATDAVARFGGDEFAVLQDGVRDTAPETLARKINKMLARPFAIDGNAVHVTASIGIALYAADVATPDALLVQADLALYRAKERGRDGFHFHSEELDRAVHERVKVASELRSAVDQREMRLFYQPQVDLASNRIIGLEALIRWQHPRRGLVSPAEFIPIAERTGGIVALGRWAIDEACRQLHAWHDADLVPGVIAVNVSAVQLKAQAGLDGFLAATLERWRIDPGDIEIELTESVLMEVSQQGDQVFEALRRLGVHTAIDDFGTGYSSLSYLTNFPVNRLKIAQDLMFGVEFDVRSATVVRAAIRLAKELGIACVAEGVESKAQAEFLAAAGCEAAQGYYFGAPVDAAQMTRRLQQEAPRRRPGGPHLALVSG